MALRKIKGSLIREIREERRLTLTQVVEKADDSFTEASLSAWELDKWEPRDENVLMLCKALECSYEDISAEVRPALKKNSKKLSRSS